MNMMYYFGAGVGYGIAACGVVLVTGISIRSFMRMIGISIG